MPEKKMRYSEQAKEIIVKVQEGLNLISIGNITEQNLIEEIDKLIEDIVTTECEDCEEKNRDTEIKEPDYTPEELD